MKICKKLTAVIYDELTATDTGFHMAESFRFQKIVELDNEVEHQLNVLYIPASIHDPSDFTLMISTNWRGVTIHFPSGKWAVFPVIKYSAWPVIAMS